MTMQFLASVRRNQKQWMVVLTILAMFAFLFDGAVRSASDMTSGTWAIFFAVLCAAGMSIIGYSRKHTVLFAAIGFIVGGSAALIGSSFAGPKPIVRTSFGNLTVNQIRTLQQTRSKINRFLAIASSKIGDSVSNFGNPDTASMVFFSVMTNEARRMGVSVSDEAVNNFLTDATHGKLTNKDYAVALKEAEYSEAELFDAIRHELEARLVGKLITPPAKEDQMLSAFTGGQLRRISQVSPEMAWESYRRLNVQQELTAVAIPVSDFVKQVPEPSDTEILKYFDERKNRYGDEQGNPGFLEQPKMVLGYLAASDLDLYEKGLTDATDQEVVDYYNAHLEEYRIRQFPDSPLFNGGERPPHTSGVESIDPDAPSDAMIPENRSVELPAPGIETPALDSTPEAPKKSETPTTEPKAPEKGEPEKKDSAPSESNAKPGEDEKPKAEEKAKSETPCGDDELKSDDKEAEAKPADPKAAEPAGEPKPEGKSEPKPEVKTETTPATKADQGQTIPPAPALPTEGDTPPKLEPPTTDPLFPPEEFSPLVPKYRALDDDLKLEIREKLLRDKAFTKMSAAADAAFQFMMDLSLNLPANAKERAEAVKPLAEKCKKYAAEHGLEYHETKPMTYLELRNSMDDRIGSATESVSELSSRRTLPLVADLVFAPDQSGRNYRIAPYSPQRADSAKTKTWYAYWTIEQIPSKVPDLKNEATRSLVVESWKFEKARQLAEVRARELSELVKKSPTDIPAALSGQSINGTKESPAVTVRESSRFSWLRTSQSVPSMGIPRPEVSEIDNVEHPGEEFMKLIFEELGEGDVGVGLNQPKTVFYVVRVHDRDGAGPDGGVTLQRLQEQFLRERAVAEIPKQGFSFPTANDFLSAKTQVIIDSHWRQSVEKRFAITWETVDSPLIDSDSE